jgi:hypothetical protein
VPHRATLSRQLFHRPEYVGGGERGSGRTYDIAADLSRFVMLKALSGDAADGRLRLVVVLNGFAELERLAPLTK